MIKKSKNKFDAIVIGAGMAGLGAAIGLAREGLKVLIISKKEKGASSPAAGGILDPFLEMSPGHPLFELSRAAFNQYPQLARVLESKTRGGVGYKKTGMLFIALNRDQMSELKNRYAWQKKTGIPIELQSREEILKKDPGVNSNLLGGLFYPTVARVHPKRLVRALESYAKLLGIKIVQTKKSPKIQIVKGRVVSVCVGEKVFLEPVVVNATGSWAGLGKSGPKLPVRPAKGEIVMVHSREKISTILHSLDGGYIVPWNDRKIKNGVHEFLLGSTVEHAGFNSKNTKRGVRKILEKNSRILPGLKNSKQVDAWAGLRPFSENKLPMIGPSKIKRLYLAAGYYRSGILIGCFAGELLAKAIVSGKMPPMIQAFAPRKYSL